MNSTAVVREDVDEGSLGVFDPQAKFPQVTAHWHGGQVGYSGDGVNTRTEKATIPTKAAMAAGPFITGDLNPANHLRARPVRTRLGDSISSKTNMNQISPTSLTSKVWTCREPSRLVILTSAPFFMQWCSKQ